ncbi:MAG TPA: CPBP family intramembrane glutamic endopeptidase [Rhodanobacteraceae bacterium]
MTTSSLPPSGWQRLFRGPDGLRAGWAVALFFVILAVVVAVLDHIAYLLHYPLQPHGALTPTHMLVTEAMLCFGALVATLCMARIDKRAWTSYGLRSRRGWAHFGQGALCGLLVLAAVMGVLWLSHAASITFSGAGAWSLVRSGVVWALAFCLVAATEELTFRGFVFFRLSHALKPVAAAVVASILFACAHLSNHGESLAGLIQVAAFGLVACLAVWRTGSLWWAMGLHAAWDWSETFLFGTADSGLAATGHLLTSQPVGPVWLSGGTVGPEGSVIVFPALLVVALVIVWTLPRTQGSSTATSGNRARGGA